MLSVLRCNYSGVTALLVKIMKLDNMSKMKFLSASIFLLALLIIMPGVAIASPVVKLTDGAEIYDISSYMEIAEDRNSEWKIEDVASGNVSDLFVAIKENSSYGKFTDSAFWLRFDLTAAPSAGPGKWFLTIPMPLLDMVEFYIPGESGQYKVKRSGRLIPLHDKEIKNRGHIFELPVSSGRTGTFYLRVKTESLLIIPASIMSGNALYRIDHIDQLVAGIYCGVVLVMAFYNLFLFFSLKEKTYLIYVAHIIMTGLYIVSLIGIGYEYLWPEMTWWNQRADVVFGGFALLFAAMFTRSFLSTATIVPKADIMLKVIMALSLVMGLVSLVLPYASSVLIVTALAGIAVVIYELSGIMALRKGYRSARFFLFAWSFFLFGVFCLVLTNLGLLPFHHFPNIVMISSIVEITLMSFALADRINILRKENEIAQAKVVHSGQLASLGELAAGVGHEINNPLQCIMNYSSIIIRSLDKEDEEREYMDIVLSESRRISAIVSSLLNLSRPTNENMEPVDIKDVVSEILALSHAQIKKDCIDVKVDIPDNLPAVKGHFQQLEQVFLNFISNSRYALNDRTDFAGDENKTISIMAESYISKDGPCVRVRFRDNGVGVPDSIKNKVITPFFTTKPTGSGTGLGLSISHDIINKHNGIMYIDSIEGEYCTAILDLPAIDSESIA